MSDSQSSSDNEKRHEGETDSEWKIRVRRIRQETVLQTLESLGFDVDDANEMQRDAIFLRKMRKASETASAKTIAAVIGLFFTLAGAAVTLFLQNYVFKG